jgi:hypothetical protein
VPRPIRLTLRPERPKCPYVISSLMPGAYASSCAICLIENRPALCRALVSVHSFGYAGVDDDLVTAAEHGCPT